MELEVEELQPETKSGGFGSLRGLFSLVVLAAIVVVLISTSFQNFEVEGSSMFPNVEDGQFVVVNKAAYHSYRVWNWARWVPFLDRDGDGLFTPFGNPERGDVVVFRVPGDDSRNFIKRVIGLPGETVEIKEGVLYIDGQAMDEDYISLPDKRTLAAQVVPDLDYFVIGDRRVDSYDSRSWGTLPRANIIGKAWFAYWPVTDFHRVKSLTPDPGATAAE